jgi:DNA polymerase V
MLGVAPAIPGVHHPIVPTIGAALAAWRRVRGNVSQIALGEAAGLGKNAVGEYERGNNSPTLESLDRLAKALKITTAELLAGPDGEPGVSETGESYAPIERDTDRPRGVHTVALPLYESIPAGGWQPDAPERVGDFHVLHHLARDNQVVVRVNGDSMHPRFLDGDLVLVDTTRRKPRSGEAIIALFQGETTFKRYRIVHRQPVLVPDNPNFPPMEIADAGELQVLGVVVRIVDRDVSKAIG